MIRLESLERCGRPFVLIDGRRPNLRDSERQKSVSACGRKRNVAVIDPKESSHLLFECFDKARAQRSTFSVSQAPCWGRSLSDRQTCPVLVALEEPRNHDRTYGAAMTIS